MTFKAKTPLQSPGRVHILASAIVLGTLTACSSVPEPIAELASAKTAVRSAEGTAAETQAPVLLERAKSKLQRAEAAMRDKDYDTARRLAEESLADAQLARAASDALIAQRSADELAESIRVLRDEINRSQNTL